MSARLMMLVPSIMKRENNLKNRKQEKMQKLTRFCNF